MKKLLLAALVFCSMSFDSPKVYTYEKDWNTEAQAQSNKTSTENYVTSHGFSLISSSITTTFLDPPFPNIYTVKVKYEDGPQ